MYHKTTNNNVYRPLIFINGSQKIVSYVHVNCRGGGGGALKFLPVLRGGGGQQEK